MRSLKTRNIERIVLWLARGWGSIILAFMLFMVIAHLFGDEEASGELSSRDIITLIFFPTSYIIGLIIAYKWEGLGGLISISSLIIGMLINYAPGTSIELNFMLITFSPALLYLLYWFISRKERRIAKRMKLH